MEESTEVILALAYQRSIIAHQNGTRIKTLEETISIVYADLNKTKKIITDMSKRDSEGKAKLADAKDAINFDHITKLADMELLGVSDTTEPNYKLDVMHKAIGGEKSQALLNYAVGVWRDNPNMKEGTPFEWSELPYYKFCWKTKLPDAS